MENHYIFLIWGNARKYLPLIKKNIDKQFTIIDHFEIQWDEYLFSRNLYRFYYDSPTNPKIKLIETGTDPFYVLIVKDFNPLFKNVSIRSRIENVNFNVYKLKNKLRKITSGGHMIHASNNIEEAKKNLYFLNIKKNSKKFIYANPKGSIYWKSLYDALYFLNKFVPYIILRGPSDINQMTINDDIDLLVADSKIAAKLLNANKCSSLPYKRNYVIKVKDKIIKIDIRDFNDNYYDPEWSKNMILNRVKNKSGFYENDKINHFYSISYHILIHKYDTPLKYRKFIQNNGSKKILRKKLNNFMIENKYKFTEPDDLSVAFKYSHSSIIRKIYIICKNIKSIPFIPKKFKLKFIKIYEYFKKNKY